jgi:hypothetical protein
VVKPAIPLADILERDWQHQVRELAAMLGYRRGYHTKDSRRSDTGFPDLVLVSRDKRRVVFLELKREKTQPTAAQADWIRDLHAAGAEVYLARPRNLDALATVLGGVTGSTNWAVAHGQLLLELDEVLAA